ncbi:MAG: hypothetical protein K6T75_08920 [Acetobacteraceae bacterium]|nr:hypothetical protein [Acetobacteraceae bacterium]
MDEELYPFRLSLAEVELRQPLYEDRVIEMFRQHILSLLDCVILKYKGDEVKVDGFALIFDKDRVYRL